MMYLAVTQQEREGSRFLNFIVMGENCFVHRQLERRGDFLFMRAKRRSV